jgi:MFS family permease
VAVTCGMREPEPHPAVAVGTAPLESIDGEQLDGIGAELRASWMPMLVVAMAQVLMVFNVSTLQVSIDGIATTFNASATAVGTAIVTYSLVCAGLILVGARVAQMLGSRRVFRVSVASFGIAMGLMAFAPGVGTMLIAQVLAGASAAVLVPSLVVMIADHYRGVQQAKALGWLGGAQAMGIVLAFLIAGYIATRFGWRITFGMLVVFAAGVLLLSGKLESLPRQSGVSIDIVGILLAASAILLISVGSNNLTDWGGLLAGPAAPFSVVDMSPAPIMILVGVFLVQAFISWSARRAARGGTPLVALAVFDTPGERAAIYSMFTIGAIGSALTFLVPLYIQVVQGGTGLDTAAAVIPFSLASFAAAVLVIRLYVRVSPRTIARTAFFLTAVALALLGATIRSDWGTPAVVLNMVLAGFGEGALVALLFNVLVAASPKDLAGDVGAVRGCTNNLAAGVGTALAGALVVSILGSGVHRELVHNTVIPNELKTELNLDDVQFVGNDQLRAFLANTAATQEQVTEAVRINTEKRLVALKISFFALSGLALLAFFPSGGLPGSTRAKDDRERYAVSPSVL